MNDTSRLLNYAIGFFIGFTLLFIQFKTWVNCINNLYYYIFSIIYKQTYLFRLTLFMNFLKLL